MKVKLILIMVFIATNSFCFSQDYIRISGPFYNTMALYHITIDSVFGNTIMNWPKGFNYQDPDEFSMVFSYEIQIDSNVYNSIVSTVNKFGKNKINFVDSLWSLQKRRCLVDFVKDGEYILRYNISEQEEISKFYHSLILIAENNKNIKLKEWLKGCFGLADRD